MIQKVEAEAYRLLLSNNKLVSMYGDMLLSLPSRTTTVFLEIKAISDQMSLFL